MVFWPSHTVCKCTISVVDLSVVEAHLQSPYSTRVNNDVAFTAPGAHGVGKSDEFLELLKADFDTLYAEGEAGAPKMM
jgi:hypothetical protein